MNNYLTLKAEFFLFLLVYIILFARVLSNINLFDNSLAVVFPVVIIPFGFIYLLLTAKKINGFNININSFLFYFILLFLIFIPFLQNIFFVNLIDSFNRSSHEFIWVISLLGISWIIAGAILGSINGLSKGLKFINLIFFFMFFLILFYSLNKGVFIDYIFLTGLRSDGIKVHHLSLTEPLMLVFYMIIAQFYNSKYKWLIILIILYWMFALGGRVAFFCFIFSILIYEFFNENKINFFLKISIIASLSTYIVLFLVSNLDNIFAFNKLFFSQGVGNDESFQSRLELFDNFSRNILSQLVIGNTNSLISNEGGLGSYVHNILSVIQFYGLIPFLIVIFSFLYIIKYIYIYRLYKEQEILSIFGVLFFMYTLLSVIVGKAVLFSSLWFILGFWFFKLKNMQVSKDVLK